jgi:Uma2 family endonuclease
MVSGLPIVSSPQADVASRLRRFTVTEYQQMAELGIFSIGERLELIDGYVMTKAAKSLAHSCATMLIQELFSHRIRETYCVRNQDPICLNIHSEPEPDVAIVQLDSLEYSTHHPTPDEVLLVIEVADSSLKYDLEVKAPLYGKSRIPEYWVVDVADRKLHVFREPNELGYQLEWVLRESMTVEPIAFADWTIGVSELLQPVSKTTIES